MKTNAQLEKEIFDLNEEIRILKLELELKLQRLETKELLLKVRKTLKDIEEEENKENKEDKEKKGDKK